MIKPTKKEDVKGIAEYVGSRPTLDLVISPHTSSDATGTNYQFDITIAGVRGHTFSAGRRVDREDNDPSYDPEKSVEDEIAKVLAAQGFHLKDKDNKKGMRLHYEKQDVREAKND